MSASDKPQVFISYSREDLDFADQLDIALRFWGFASTIDRHGISGGEEWQRRLGNLIRDADTIVFVLSPSSATSSICAWEVEEAARLGKRMIPVNWAFRLRREVNPFTDAQIALEETTIPNAREAFLNYHRARPSSGSLLAGKSAFASARKRRNS